MRNCEMTRRAFVGTMTAAGLTAADDGWVALFNGRNLDGWRAEREPEFLEGRGWATVGRRPAIAPVLHRPGARTRTSGTSSSRSRCMRRPGANSGIYFHTAYQEKGFPQQGLRGPDQQHRHRRRQLPRAEEDRLALRRAQHVQATRAPTTSGSRSTSPCAARTSRCGSTACCWWTTPSRPRRSSRRARSGSASWTAARSRCNATTPVRRCVFRSIRVRPLADDLATPGEPAPVVDDVYRQIITLGAQNIPMVDFHVHLKSGFTAGAGAGQVAARRHPVRHRGELRQGLPRRERRGRAPASWKA